jgi:hypothetical protein
MVDAEAAMVNTQNLIKQSMIQLIDTEETV